MREDSFTLLAKDLDKKLLFSINYEISKFSTILMKVVSEGSKEVGLPIGSGTFVRYKEIFAILTCRHVTELLNKNEKLGLVIHERSHRFRIPVEFLQIITMGNNFTESEGPDLALIILPRIKVGDIGMYKSFYPLDSDQDLMLHNPPELNSGFWFLCGAPDIKTEFKSSSNQNEYDFVWYSGVGGVDIFYFENGYDYCDYQIENIDESADMMEADTIPISFGGISGGGLWQVQLTKSSNGIITPLKYYFSGVPYYQTELQNKQRIVKCHGRTSVYENVVAELEKISQDSIR